MNGRGQSATVIDGRAGTVIATIPLGGKPESAAVDVTTHRVFINIEDKNTIAVVDTSTHKVLSEWPIAPGEEPTGLAFDPEGRRLFVGCRNRMMLMIDAGNGHVLGNVPAGEGVDATWFDPSTRLVFSSAREGVVTIARAEPSRLTTVATLKTFPGARTMALDTKTHRIYLSTATYRPLAPGAPGINGADPKPEPIPETFRVLVFAAQGK
jgi:DNA-binding beta-propeller fold protein YncE